MEKTVIESTSTRSARRDQIAEAGIRIIAQRGVRALTHRAVDDEAHLPPGSTSYYARTRRALIDEIVRVLAEHSISDLEEAARGFASREGASGPVARDELVASMIEAVDALARRPDELKARCALLLELDHDEPARTTLAERSPVLRQMAQGVTDALEAAGIAATTDHAFDLMSLCDALLMRAVITGMPPQVAPILSAYVHGLADATAGSARAGARRRSGQS
ncbi:TetR/AcrR family transcriptional regulator [Brachybacterium hainanense]|uniref:TetR/AcrR family transcriptional regulator n=1 Tax=Brachybacterium hainanense TaxID=1541174 RepID=A0ABV6RD88_9MICO